MPIDVAKGAESSSSVKNWTAVLSSNSKSKSVASARIRAALDQKLPLGLFLGQDAWAKNDIPDAVLSRALKHVGQEYLEDVGWSALLKTASSDAGADDLNIWLAEQFRRRVRPQWLQSTPKLPWSVIATTYLDQTIRLDMRVGARDPVLVLSEHEKPIVARSIARPPLYYFFGMVANPDPSGAPPRTNSELRARRTMHAGPMVRHLVESVTPLGLLFIDGYDPRRDWLRLDDMLALIESLPIGHVLWFGVSDKFFENPDLVTVLKDREVVVVTERVGEVLDDLESSGLDLSDLAASIAQPYAISLTGKAKHSFVPAPEMRTRVEAAAAIVDDSWGAFLAPKSSEDEYFCFRRFHGGFGSDRDLLEGVRRHYAISRDFENRLQSLVEAALEDHASSNAIIVSGRSGTGKSIAVARLAANIRAAGKAAVLLARYRLPLEVEIDDFCSLAESHGAVATLLICDLNIAAHRYRDVLTGLRARGRRVVVVGSGYPNDTELPDTRLRIDAPAKLSSLEQTALAALFNRFGLQEFAPSSDEDQYVLAVLYRALPPARPQLMSGLSREARDAEHRFRLALREVSPRNIGRTEFAQKLLEAGLISERSASVGLADSADLSAADDAAGRTIDFVMLAGQVGCAIPINLLMRAVASIGEVDYSVFAKIFADLDLIRIREATVEGEEFVVGPRLPIEAELLCRARLGNSVAQAELIISLIKSARLGWDAGGSERRFVVDFVRRLGPDGPQQRSFRQIYLLIADALADIRKNGAVADPALMLQESFLCRKAVQDHQLEGRDSEEVLMGAQEAVAIALDIFSREHRRGALKVYLLVEQAAVLGFLAVQRARKGQAVAKVLETYAAGRMSAKAASGLSDQHYSSDVRLWMPKLLYAERLGSLASEELRADAAEVIAERESGPLLSPEQTLKLNKNRLEFGQIFGDEVISEHAFQELAAAGSTAGYFLRARFMAPARDEIDQSIETSLVKARKTVEFLRNNWSIIKGDARLLRLLFQYEWLIETHALPFARSRGALPSEKHVINNFYDLTRSINLLSSYNDNLFHYMEAVLAWLLDYRRESAQLFEDIGRSSEYSDARRTHWLHTITDTNGRPKVFSGRIREILFDGVALVDVDELNRNVRMRAFQFPQYEFAKGRAISKFGIAFNFSGPLADPVR